MREGKEGQQQEARCGGGGEGGDEMHKENKNQNLQTHSA